jgi:hypothetical protein
MTGQYLPNNNKTATVAFRQKFCQLNSPLQFHGTSCKFPTDVMSPQAKVAADRTPKGCIKKNHILALFIWLIIRLIQLVFSAGTIFFSHKKSANSVFQPTYNSSRTWPFSFY